MRPSAGVDLQICSQRVELDTIIIATASVAIPAVKIPIERLEACLHSPENTPAAHAVKTIVI
jgi:hypothetical protein